MMDAQGNLGGSDSGSAQPGSFAEAFNRIYGGDSGNNLRPGRVVKGTIMGMDKEFTSIDIGFKSFGIVPTVQFLNADGDFVGKVGDEVDVSIIQLENDNGQLMLSREKAVQLKVWEQVEKIFKEDGTVTGRIVQKVKGGLQVDIGIPAFLPGSQIDLRPHRNLDKFIGEEHEFKILKVTKEKGNIVLSRRALLVSERDALRSETLKVLGEGVVMEGVVKNVTDYGAFIDLGGIDGLLHVTDISWGRVNHPADRLTVGEKVPVVVLKYDRDSQRVSLGMKQLKSDPWMTVEERYPVGKRVHGRVAGLVDYGAFIELEEGVEGLIHVSDMSWTKKPKHPSKILNENEQVEVQVLEVNHEDRRLSLGLKQLLPNPWDELRHTHPPGTRVRGKVRSVTDFGIFVGVADGIDGLVHVSDFSWTKRIKDPKEIQEGDEVEAVVLDVDAENERLSLGVKQLGEDPWERISMRYPVGSRVRGRVTSITNFGVFVEIEEGIEGLIHNTQLGLDKGQDPTSVFQTGNEVEAEVTNIERDDRRISLSIGAIKRRAEREEEMSGFQEDSEPVVTLGDLLRRKLEDYNE